MKKILLIAVIIIAAIAFAGCGKNDGTAPTVSLPGVSRTVATVDGLNITSKEYQTFMHDNFGDKALAALCQEKIMEKWALDLKVSPTKEDEDAIIKSLKEGPEYEFATMQIEAPVLDKTLSKMAKEQALQQNLAKKLHPVKDKDIQNYYKNNKDRYVYKEYKAASIIMLGSNEKKAKAAAEKLSAVTDNNTFPQAIREAKKSNPDISAVPGMKLETLKGFDPSIEKLADNLKDGEFSKVSKMNGSGYYILRVTTVPASDKKFEDVKDEIEGMLALQGLYSDPKFRTEMEERTKKAEIQINIPEYADVAEQVKNPQSQQPGMGGY